MGFGDKLKGLRDQAQQAVAENKDKIQGAVQVVGEAANTKTHGKYAAKIAQVGEKVSGNIDKIAGDTPEGESAAASPEGESAAASPEGESAAATPGAPDPAFPIEDGAPTEDSSSAPIAHDAANPVTPSAADTARSGFPEFE